MSFMIFPDTRIFAPIFSKFLKNEDIIAVSLGNPMQSQDFVYLQVFPIVIYIES